MKVKVVLSCVALLLLTFGIYILIFETEYNRCVMTYMYEIPRYQKVKLDKHIQKRFPNYNLYFYGEGDYFTQFGTAERLDGIPVLFIPGNAGSYRQVRSMGSVALRMAESLRKTYYFNYFSIDFNEELSAFYGDFVKAQTQFAVQCIKIILSKCKAASSVVVIGHSMGGIVARNLFHTEGFQPQWVHTIITQSTPHRMPVFPPDVSMKTIYDRLDLFWRQRASATLAHVTLVSLTGGTRDLQVRDGLGDVSVFAAVKRRSLGLSTSSVRGAWASTDHLCAVWCKQIVMNLNRALFEMVDPATNQLTTNARKRITIFRRHLVVGGNRNAQGGKAVPLDAGGQWIYKENVDKFTFQREELNKEIFIKFGPFSAREAFRAVFVINEVKSPWLFLCQTQKADDPCSSGVDVTSWAVEAPPFEMNRRVLHLERKMFESSDGDVYLVARLQPTRKELEVFYERYDVKRRHISHDPGFLDFLLGLPGVSELHGRALLTQTEPGAVYYRIALPGLYHVRQGLEVKARVLSCAGTAGSVGLISLHSPWDGYFVHSSLWYWNNASLNLNLASSKPAKFVKQAFVEMVLDPTCQYRVFLHHSVGSMVSQFLRVYAPLIPTYVLVHILGGLAMQLLGAARGEMVESILTVKSRVPLVLPSLIIGYILNSSPLSTIPLPKNDMAILQEEGLWFPLVMQTMFIVSIAFFVLLYGICRLIVSVLALPLCRQGARLPCRVAAHIIGFIFAVLAIGSASRVCGGLAMLILCFGQLLLTAVELASKHREESFNFRFSILLLLTMLAILDAPNLIVWSKMLIDNDFKRLPPATGMGSLPVVMSFAFLSLSRADPTAWIKQSGLVRVVAYIAMVCAVAAPLYSTFAFHCLKWNISICLTAMAFVVLISKVRIVRQHQKME